MKHLSILLYVILIVNLSNAQSSIPIGATCPDFSTTDINGNSHNLSTYCQAGKYVIIEFFTYWCVHCIEPALNLHEFYIKYGCNQGDVIVLGIESDANSTTAQLLYFKELAGIPSNSFPTVLGSSGGNSIRNQYGISGFPTFVLIGPNQKMINNGINIWSNPEQAYIVAYEGAFPAGAITAMSCAPVSIEQNLTQSNLNVYPNPVLNELNVKIPNIQEIQIIDISGKTISSSCFQNEDNINMSVIDLQSGIYIIQVKTKVGVVSKKFLKN